jgi:peptidoglycan lytic transglycosylase G
MTDDWLQEDPFANPEDPAAREREQRRRAREEKRAGKRGVAGGDPGEDSPSQQRGGSVESAPGSPNEQPAVESLSPRTPEEEFWDEGPAEEEPGVVEVPFEGEPIEAPPVAVAPQGSRGGSGSGGGRGFLATIGRHPFRLVGAVVAVLVLWFLFALFQPFHGDGSGQVQVTIPKGASVSEVADLLDEKGVIDNSTFFQIRTTLAGKRSELYPGHFTLAHGMSYGAAIDALSKPPVKRVTTVTIPEGYSRSQAAQLVEEDGLEGDYTKETVHSKYLNPAKYGGKGAKNLEGFLFPDTFEMKPGAPTADLVQLQLQDFKRRIKGVDMSYAKSKNLTVFDVLTIASMIEREAGVASQRKLVASVVYNRLHEGMPLGIDATIRFATGNYEEPLTESQLAVDSPYNTRTNAGLPPGPINSPGIESIEAAAHPAKSGYLFYVNKPNTCNELAFAKNEAEFESDVAKYNAAREANGGNEPSTCGE